LTLEKQPDGEASFKLNPMPYMINESFLAYIILPPGVRGKWHLFLEVHPRSSFRK
jgi:hypothetical protein